MNDLDSTRAAAREQTLERQRRLQSLSAERDRMRQVLSDVEAGRRSPVEIPSDAYTYFGRIETLNRTIRVHEAGCLIEELTTYAEFRENLNRQGSAETVIARRFSQQLQTGYPDVDLTQQYATDDAQAATARHELALTRLSDFISRAEQIGYRVHGGEAIAVALKHTQALAIASGLGG
jgi:hypothetical protein